MTEPTPHQPARQLVLEIDDAQFSHTVRATGVAATPVKDFTHVAIRAWLFSPANADDRLYLINVMSDDKPPHERVGGRMVGRILFTDEHAQAVLYMPPGPAWHLFAAVKSSTMSHITLWLEPDETADENLVVSYALHAQEEADLLLEQYDVED